MDKAATYPLAESAHAASSELLESIASSPMNLSLKDSDPLNWLERIPPRQTSRRKQFTPPPFLQH
jgi:hypothetical protein